MKWNKSVFATLLTVGLAASYFGCSSKSKSDVNKATPFEDKKADDSDSADATLSESKAAPAAPKAETTPRPDVKREMQAQLQQAIKSGSEADIRKASLAALAANSQDASALNALGVLYFQKGKYAGSLYFFKRAIKVQPNNADAHTNLGLVHLANNEQHEALVSFKKALELDPNNGAAAADAGAIYVQEHDFTKAAITLEIAIKKYPADYKVLVNYGSALAGAGRYAEAKTQFEKALRMNSSGREATLNMAMVDIQYLKQYAEGLDLLNKVKFFGGLESYQQTINTLETEAKAGLK